jgi:DHA2 family methylenomycin A resistance protein-like MFS transporter
VVCGVAPTSTVLILARALQGVGAALLVPGSLALLSSSFAASDRGRAIGAWSGLGTVFGAAGPFLGGLLVATGPNGWRWIFLVNVPVCALTLVLLRRHVRESPADPSRRTDLAGLFLGVAALAGLTGGFITAGEQGWTAPLPGALLAAGVAAGLLLVRAERRRAAPMLPLGLFRSVNLSAATGVGVLFNLCIYGALICLSLFLQQARHESALATGLLILPMSVAVGIGSMASGPLTARLGPRIPMTAGLALAAAGAAVLAAAGPDAPLTMITAGSVLLGLCSLAMPAMTAVVVGSAGREHAGVASGILNAARQAGGALGVAILGALFASSQAAGHGMTLRVPLTVAAVGYLLAIGLTLAIRADR